MLRHMSSQAARLDHVFHALADPTRRAVLERLNRGPAAMSELARAFAMALPSFSQHLEVLENCGLVKSRKLGRIRTFRLAPRSLNVAEHWLAKQRAHWESRLDQLDAYLIDLKKEQR